MLIFFGIYGVFIGIEEFHNVDLFEFITVILIIILGIILFQTNRY